MVRMGSCDVDEFGGGVVQGGSEVDSWADGEGACCGDGCNDVCSGGCERSNKGNVSWVSGVLLLGVCCMGSVGCGVCGGGKGGVMLGSGDGPV